MSTLIHTPFSAPEWAHLSEDMRQRLNVLFNERFDDNGPVLDDDYSDRTSDLLVELMDEFDVEGK